MSDLSQFTTDELLAEIVKRRNISPNQSEPKKFCDECKNFRAWTKIGDAPEDYNPCSKGHAMTFRCPRLDDSPHSTEWGFHRRVCEDRAQMSDEEFLKDQEKMQKLWQRLYGYASAKDYAKDYAKGLSEV